MSLSTSSPFAGTCSPFGATLARAQAAADCSDHAVRPLAVNVLEPRRRTHRGGRSSVVRINRYAAYDARRCSSGAAAHANAHGERYVFSDSVVSVVSYECVDMFGFVEDAVVPAAAAPSAAAAPASAAAAPAVAAFASVISPSAGVSSNIEVPANVLGPREAGSFRFLNFSFLHCNIRGFLSHRALLEGQLRLLGELPAVICLNETFLEESTSNTAATLGGYNLVARRDRKDGRSGGGILCFVAASISAQVTLCEHSADYERSWLTIHSEIGPMLLGVWYRPPVRGEVGSITACEVEWQRLSSEHVASILAQAADFGSSSFSRVSALPFTRANSILSVCH